MTFDSLRRRITRIEAARCTGQITGLCNLAAFPDHVAAQAVREWHTWVADGRASRCGDVLILRGPVLTAADWSAIHSPRSGALQ